MGFDLFDIHSAIGKYSEKKVILKVLSITLK